MHIVENVESKKSTKVQKVPEKKTQNTDTVTTQREVFKTSESCLAFKEPRSQLSL